MGPVCQNSQRSWQKITLSATSSPTAVNTAGDDWKQEVITWEHSHKSSQNLFRKGHELAGEVLFPKTLFDTNPCCRPKWDPVLLLAPGWHCPWLHWVAWHCAGDLCCPWAHGAETTTHRGDVCVNTWNYMDGFNNFPLFQETHQWFIQSGELHEVWCEDALLIALNDRWLLWN